MNRGATLSPRELCACGQSREQKRTALYQASGKLPVTRLDYAS